MARHPKPLTPSQQKLYDAWVDNSTRRLVLDQAQRCQINPSFFGQQGISCETWYLAGSWSKYGATLPFFAGNQLIFPRSPKAQTETFFNFDLDVISIILFSLRGHGKQGDRNDYPGG